MNDKIGIITVYGENNYGNKLQNYASIKIFENLGYNPETIRVFQSRMNLSTKENVKMFIKKIISNLPQKKYLKYQYIKEEKFINFSKRYLNITERFSTSNIPIQFLDKYNYLSVGSDQVWNDTDFNTYDLEYFLLQGVENTRKIALSPSFGKTFIKSENISIFKKSLSEFHALSCREKDGVQLIESLINKKCTLLIDPTMVLTSEEWRSIQKKPEWIKSNRFTVCYFLGGIERHYKRINKECKEKSLDIIDVLNKKNVSYTTSPEEFIYLINNAEVVYTDSFHACVFSILFNKEFVVYHRSNQESEMESRIKNLLHIFGVETIEYGKKYSGESLKNVEKVLLDKRSEFLQYIKEALS